MIKEFIKDTNSTLLCTGPMSKNCIDSTIEISKQLNIPQVLIASRRQIDSKEFGKGYVENFSTEEFAKYVRNQNAKKVYLARDHGGPWQSTFEKHNDLNIVDSMQSAKKSFENDILSGFDFLHLDPSIPIQNEKLDIDTILNRLFELYGHTFEFSQQHNKEIQFELGTEEQNGYGQNLEEFEYFLNKTDQFCEKNKIKKPTFVVAQTGTKVIEAINDGEFETAKDIGDLIKKIKDTLQVCQKYDVLLKEHNTDYLNNHALSLRPNIGIHASNVAPEFGVIETRGLLYILQLFGYKKEYDLFIRTALESRKWEKWMLKKSKSTELEKAIISGHYIFSNISIIQMKQKVSQELLQKNFNLDDYLKRLIKQSILKYIQLFKMI